jgi:UDP-N-acetylmuramyl pentapeptide phosphotransferase/UDP-N-acetylglucosamine-1-phosphate transferase
VIAIAMILAPAALAFGLIVLLRPLLVRYALARPNARSSHKAPTPQGGGIAVIAAVALVLAAASILLPSLFDDRARLAVVTACAIALGGVGAFDDIRPLAALPRLLLQGIAVAVVLAALPAELRLLPALPWWLERGLLFVGALWFVNLVNFMDGIDWMTVAEVVPVTAALAVFGALGALPHDAMLLSLALCGAMIGFAPFNRPLARLFLGDVGSLPIGLLLAWLLIRLGEDHLAAALLLPLYYAADATVTLLRRLARGERVTQAHRSHFYQQALDGGMSVMRIVGRVFWLNIALALLAFATLLSTALSVQLAALAIGAVLVALMLRRFSRGAA